LHNLNELTEESCGLYKRLFVGEQFYLRPEDAFRIGKQEFLLERFNTGIISDIGQRKSMEDSYCCIQDLKIDPKTTVSYYGVFDGHGGSKCAQYLRCNLHKFITKQFLDLNEGIVEA